VALLLVAAITTIVAGSAGIVAGYAIRGDTSNKTAPHSASSSIAGGIVLPTFAIGPGAGAALLARIVPPPAGSVVIVLPNAPGGQLTLEQDVLQFFPSAPLEADTLRAGGFVASAATEYKRPDGFAILTHLTQFATADGAGDYFSARKAVWVATANVSDSFAVPGGGIGFDQNRPDAAGRRLTVMYEQVGTVVIAVDVFTSGQLSRSVDLATMAAQVAKAS
jgi:hypothetical protein